MAEVGARRTAVRDAIHERAGRCALRVQRVRRPRLAVVLLHVARLAIAFERRIELRVPRPVGIAAARPLGVGALDREAADPFADVILDRERIGHVVAPAAELRAGRQHLTEALVLRGVHLLVGRRCLEDAAQVAVRGIRVRFERQRSRTVGDADGVRRQAERASADAVSEIGRLLIGHFEDVLIGGGDQLGARLGAQRGHVAVPLGRGRIVVKRRVARVDRAVAHHARDAGLARIGVAPLRPERGERQTRLVGRCRVEVGIEPPVLGTRRHVDGHVLERHLVDVAGRHMAPRAHAVAERSAARQSVMLRADVEHARSGACHRERIVLRFRRAVGRLRHLAVPRRRGFARR